MTTPDTTTDLNSRGVFESSGQGVNDAAAKAGRAGPSTGLDALDEVLGKHADKTKDELKDAEKTLKKSAQGITDSADTDKRSAGLFGRGTPPPGGQPMGGAPMSAAPQAMPAAAPMAMPAPQAMSSPTPAPIPAGMRPISPDALATLLSNAGVTPTSAAAAGDAGRSLGSGQKEPLSAARYERSGRGPMSPAELRVAIDKALDANGTPDDKRVRAKWHTLFRHLIDSESSGRPDIIQGVQDINQSGPTISDGGRANAARGLCQVIPSTFTGYHVAGTSNNIFDPVANIAASQRYLLEKYGLELTAGAKFDSFLGARTPTWHGY